MTEKKTPIIDHKDEDVKLIRLMLLKIINDEEVPKKDRTEAAKLLARLHHALQIDRSVTKDIAKKAQKLEKLSKEDEGKLKQLLDA